MPFCLVLLLTRPVSCAQPEEACLQLTEDAEALRVLVQQCLQDGQLAPPDGKLLMERFERKLQILELQKQRRKLARQDAAAAELEPRARANREKIMLGL